MTLRIRTLALATASAFATAIAAQAADLTVDATRPPAAVRSEHLRMGASTAPDGQTLGVNNRYLTRNGQPWIPVMGEFHYTRYPPENWNAELAKMKAQGVDIVATYIIWNHHEERAGQFNWAGDRDLKRFVALAKANGLMVVIRIGPWAHGEVRWGGAPDWVVNAMPTRRDDPVYLTYVERYWREIYRQVEGQLWKDGGPVVGVQLENEYNVGGPGAGVGHIATLKTLARKIGFDVPLYTVTGWDNAVYPKGEVIPVFGGYADEPWSGRQGRLPPKEVYAFRFASRVGGDLGAQTTSRNPGTIETDMDNTPFLGAEFGGGVPIMYRRRPHLSPDDVAAMLPVQLGSGANLYGYYMFHGGRNPQGRTTLEEDDRQGGYNGMPIINYDFQAPLGQYGQVHPVADAVRPYHLFMKAFGARLAPMEVQRPAERLSGRDDVSTPRWSVRSQGDRGFLFFNNHVRQFETPVQAMTRFEVKLPGGLVTFPSRAVDIPAGAYFVWPINLDLDGANLAWASAQPLTRLEDADGPVYVFSATKGVPVEMAFSADVEVTLNGKRLKAAGGRVVTPSLTPEGVRELAVRVPGGKRVRIVLISAEQARQAYLLPFGGKERLVLSEDPIFADDGGWSVRSKVDAGFRLSVLPALDAAPVASLPLRRVKGQGAFQVFEAQASAKTLTAGIKPLREAQGMPAPEIGGRAKAVLQPYAEQYGRSGAWTLSLPKGALDGLSEAWLEIDYAGDVARLFDGVEMLDDQFYYGPKWEVGLSRFGDRLGRDWTLTVLPLRADNPLYIQPEVKAPIPAGGQVGEVRGVRIVPEYELRLTSGTSK